MTSGGEEPMHPLEPMESVTAPAPEPAPSAVAPPPEVAFEYAPLPDVDDPLRERLGQYPRQPDISIELLRLIGRTVMVVLFRLQFRLVVRGGLPDSPRLALVGNHQSHLDGLSVIAALPARRRREVAALAARDYFFSRGLPAVMSSLFGQAVAFDRTRVTELRRWARLLRAQERGTLVAFPSGSRKSREIHPGLLAVLADCEWPIVPVALHGTAEAWPVGRAVWRPFRTIRVTFGAPLTAPADELVAALEAFWQGEGL
jgi:1-acyl-sn-glycerol-3-phosphate acyltransferase